jgi:Subtilase family
MHRVAWFGVVLILAGLWAAPGCNGGKGTAGTGGGKTSSSESSASSGGAGGGVDVATASCPGDRWVGVSSSTQKCPLPKGGADGGAMKWTVSPLFNADPGEPPVPGGYCLYEWNAPNEAPDKTMLPESSDPNNQNPDANPWLDKDCEVVAQQSIDDATAATDSLAKELTAAFLAAVEAPVSPAPLPPPPPGTSVRISIIDSWATPDAVGTSPHGFSMAGIVDELACGEIGFDDSSCPNKTVPELTLNLLKPGDRDPMGGYFGFQSHLAQVIQNAVSKWSGDPAKPKLIINLSLGWDKSYNGGATGMESKPVLAVKDAIAHAVCQGALVFVAAGNSSERGPMAHTGPLYPAAWEATEPAPLADPLGGACQESPPKGPLLYAVGGVEDTDYPLSNIRLDGRPQLAAPGFMAPSTKTPAGGKPVNLGPYTGSSVAAAVASGIAAAVWHFNPIFKSSDVVDRLEMNSEVLNEPADFYFCPKGGCAAPKIQRISLCRALASSLPASDCPAALTIAKYAGHNPEPTAGDLATFDTAATLLDATSSTTMELAPHCSTGVYASSKFTGPTACPSETRPDDIINVAIVPQPRCPPCPACSLLGTTKANMGDPMYLSLAIDASLTSALHPMSLTLWVDERNAAGRYDLYDITDTASSMLYGVEGLKPGSVYKFTFTNKTGAYGTNFRYATVEWIDETGTQTQSPLIVY